MTTAAPPAWIKRLRKRPADVKEKEDDKKEHAKKRRRAAQEEIQWIPSVRTKADLTRPFLTGFDESTMRGLLQEFGFVVVVDACKKETNPTIRLPSSLSSVVHDPPPRAGVLHCYNEYKDDFGPFTHAVCTGKERSKLKLLAGSHERRFRKAFFFLYQRRNAWKEKMIQIASKKDDRAGLLRVLKKKRVQSTFFVPPRSLVVFHPRVFRKLDDKVNVW